MNITRLLELRMDINEFKKHFVTFYSITFLSHKMKIFFKAIKLFRSFKTLTYRKRGEVSEKACEKSEAWRQRSFDAACVGSKG